MDPNQEFRDLLVRSGWNQSEAARQLELQPPTVSRYVNDQDKPDKQTLRLFKLLLAGNIEQGRGLVLHDASPDYAVDDLISAVEDAQQKILTVKRMAQRLKPRKKKSSSAMDRATAALVSGKKPS